MRGRRGWGGEEGEKREGVAPTHIAHDGRHLYLSVDHTCSYHDPLHDDLQAVLTSPEEREREKESEDYTRRGSYKPHVLTSQQYFSFVMACSGP